MNSENDNLVGCVTAYFEHGLLLIEDVDTAAAHAGWDAASQFVHFDTDSLYLAVRPAVEGPVTVHVYRHEAPTDTAANMVPCFDAQFESKTGAVKLHDPNDSITLTTRRQPGRRRIRVLVDQPEWAERVFVVVA